MIKPQQYITNEIGRPVRPLPVNVQYQHQRGLLPDQSTKADNRAVAFAVIVAGFTLGVTIVFFATKT